MFFEPINEFDARQQNAQVLSFVGDAVYTLLIRQRLALSSTAKSGALHKEAIKALCASGQAELYLAIEPHLNADELSVAHRALNAHPRSRPKNADLPTYLKATALEAVIGYLYLTGNDARLQQLLDL